MKPSLPLMDAEIAGVGEKATGGLILSFTLPNWSVALNPGLLVGLRPVKCLTVEHIARSPILWTIHPSDSVRDTESYLAFRNSLFE